MSNLVIVLRHRLDDVKNWVKIDPVVLESARDRLGLSREAVARQIPVASKTIERWEKQGRVPREVMPKLMAILEIELEAPSLPPVRFSGEPPDWKQDVTERLERIEQLLRDRPTG